MTHDPTNPFAPRGRSAVPNRSEYLLAELRKVHDGSWLIPSNLGFSSEDVAPLYDRGIIDLSVQMGMATCRIKTTASRPISEMIANRIIGAFIVEPCEKVRKLATKWIEEAAQSAIKEERDRCAAIISAARLGEIDHNLRSIIHFIESGQYVQEIKG